MSRAKGNTSQSEQGQPVITVAPLEANEKLDSSINGWTGMIVDLDHDSLRPTNDELKHYPTNVKEIQQAIEIILSGMEMRCNLFLTSNSNTIQRRIQPNGWVVLKHGEKKISIPEHRVPPYVLSSIFYNWNAEKLQLPTHPESKTVPVPRYPPHPDGTELKKNQTNEWDTTIKMGNYIAFWCTSNDTLKLNQCDQCKKNMLPLAGSEVSVNPSARNVVFAIQLESDFLQYQEDISKVFKIKSTYTHNHVFLVCRQCGLNYFKDVRRLQYLQRFEKYLKNQST